MDHVKSHIARPGQPHYRIGIGSVVIYQTTGGVNDFSHCTDVFFKQPQRTGIGQHQRRCVRIYGSTQSIQVDGAIGMRFDFDGFHATDTYRRRIRSMRRIRYDHADAVFLTPIAMISPDQFQPGQFAMSARNRLQRHRIHARNFCKHLLQFKHQLQCALRVTKILQWVQPGPTRQGSNIFIHFRIVFHRTGS